MLCAGRTSARRSTGAPITDQTAIYIADTLGEMGIFYRLSPFCFLGGTLVPLGGHNPLEPAACTALFWRVPTPRMPPAPLTRCVAAQGFGRVHNSADIAREAARLLREAMTPYPPRVTPLHAAPPP